TRHDPEVFADQLDKYAVFWFDGDRTDLEAAVDSFAGEPVTVRAWGEVLVFRHGDSVRSQAAFKERFGEFTIRPSGGGFEQERAWRDENIVTDSIPLLGSVTCHRDFVAMLAEAMTAVEEAGSGEVINRASFHGCWNPRFIAGRQAISHHSFGAAADINIFEPLDGPYSPTDPGLLVALFAAGLTSGHIWVNPDPGHFEWFND
ncbi:MAG: M15 family metallopeptidase, partial [Actinomycetia bacterium]|nr:M15 family metallopeptidase [Actinomycetes bacterium]